jgi:hypothetical protein
MNIGKINAYCAGGTSETVEALQKMIAKVANGGNFVLASCFTAEGNEGDEMLRTLYNLGDQRINVFGSTGSIRHNKAIDDHPELGLNISGTLNSTDRKTKKVLPNTWKGIFHYSDMRIHNFSDVIISRPENTIPIRTIEIH